MKHWITQSLGEKKLNENINSGSTSSLLEKLGINFFDWLKTKEKKKW